MANNKKFGMLRRILHAIGLSKAASDDAVDFVADLLSAKNDSKSSTIKTGEDSQQVIAHPYHLRDNFLSPAEYSFFKVLEQVLADRAFLCTKVNLSDIFWVKADDYGQRRAYTNKIDRKHIDFLLCDSTTMQPILGIELDDKSHKRKDRQARDVFVDQVFAAANLPLLHIVAKRTYHTESIAAQIASYLPDQTTQTINRVSVVETSGFMSECPKCRGEMVLRKAKRGANKGKEFWGCSNYPQCRTVLKYKPVTGD